AWAPLGKSQQRAPLSPLGSSGASFIAPTRMSVCRSRACWPLPWSRRTFWSRRR
ncbi:unnamed protein product, partial [Effrenium voratum]